MSRADPAANLKALVALKLPPETLVPALLEALHHVVPSARNLLDWTDESGHLQRYFFEGPIDEKIARHYFDEFHNRREGEAMPAFGELRHMPSGVLGAEPLNTARFFSSALYQEVWRPQGLKYRIEAVLRGSRHQLLGSLVLYRGPGERCFAQREEQALAQALPWVCEALENCQAARTPGLKDTAMVRAQDAAQTLLVAPGGRVAHASPGARGLLMLAQGGVNRSRLEQPLEGLAGPALGHVLRAAQAVAASRFDISPTSGHSHFLKGTVKHTSDDGLLTFEATVLQDQGGLPGSDTASPAHPASPTSHWMAVTLHRNEPHAVALERALRSLPLTAGQRRVCRALYGGASQGLIADELGVALSTVVDHVRKLYRTLQVRSVLELRAVVDALIHQGKAPPLLALSC